MVGKVPANPLEQENEEQAKAVQEYNDVLMHLNFQLWENYLWLKEQPGFDRIAFVKRMKAPLFKVKQQKEKKAREGLQNW